MKLLLVNAQINRLYTALEYTSGGKNVEKGIWLGGLSSHLLVSYFDLDTQPFFLYPVTHSFTQEKELLTAVQSLTSLIGTLL